MLSVLWCQRGKASPERRGGSSQTTFPRSLGDLAPRQQGCHLLFHRPPRGWALAANRCPREERSREAPFSRTLDSATVPSTHAET